LGNPFNAVTTSEAWRSGESVTLARQMYEANDFAAMPALANALQEAGCDSVDILDHCRSHSMHARGCWVLDWVLGRG
jgi:hypothetical protein